MASGKVASKTAKTTAKTTSRKRTTTADTRSDQLALWTVRTLVHTGAYRRLIERWHTIDENLLRAAGLAKLKDANLDEKSAYQYLSKRLDELEQSPIVREGLIFENLDKFAQLFDLTQDERDILAFAAMLELHDSLSDCFSSLDKACSRTLRTWIGRILGIEPDAVAKALRKENTLVSCRLVRLSPSTTYVNDRPLEIMSGLTDVLVQEFRTSEEMLEEFFRRSPAPTLQLEDFLHIEDDVVLLRRLLSGALQKKAMGVNILLYGAPGTGKTELARVLVKALESDMYEVNVESSDGEPLDSSSRLTSFMLCQRLLAKRQNTLVLFDEIEDVFPDTYESEAFREVSHGRGAESGVDKGFVNRLLEGNPIPALWLSNRISQIDPAFLRRFDAVVELKQPPPAVRGRMLRKHLAGLPIRDSFIAKLSHDHRLSPGHIERAAKAARLLDLVEEKDSEQSLERLLSHNLAAVDPVPPRLRRDALGGLYDLAYVNANLDLTALANALVKRPTGSVCLFGPPGTGKTAFVHHVAERVGLPCLSKRASDLLGPYVGETEAKIAAMFAEAKAQKAILLLDEADSFLQDRSRAMRSWEISQVNEMLVQMEDFSGLFFCSTNLMDSLDMASLRRFSVKIKFDFLRPQQRLSLFSKVLVDLGGDVDGIDESIRQGLARLQALTPGDFAAVHKKAGVLGIRYQADSLLRALDEECRFKHYAKSAVGFGVA